MANISITQLPTAQTLDGSESVPIVQRGVTVQTTTAAIANSPVLTQTFLTVGAQPGLANSRYLTTGAGMTTVDGGSASTFSINLTGAPLSLVTSGTGFQVKTNANTLINRSIAVGNGLAIENADGVAGNPRITYSGWMSNLAGLGGTGFVTINGATASQVTIIGTANQTTVLNGNGVGSPTIGLADNAVVPGTGSLTVPVGSLAQRPIGALGQIRYDTTLASFQGYTSSGWGSIVAGVAVTLINTGTGLTGGPITSSGTISLADTAVTPATYGSATQVGQFAVNAQGQLSFAGNVTISPAAIGAVVSVAGTANEIASTGTTAITLSLPTALTFTGKTVTGGAFDMTSATVGSDTVATLAGLQILTNKSISGITNTLSAIPNSALTNNAVTYNGSTVALGGSATITAVNPNALTIGTGLTGTSYSGSSAVTVAIDSTVVTLAGIQTLTNKTLTGAVINGGTANGIVIGGVTPAAATFTSTAMTTGSVSTAPAADIDIANKLYVDTVAQGLSAKASCVVATTVAITLLGNQIIDGVLTVAGNRVLVKNQASAQFNGVYVAAATAWTRAPDMDTWAEVPGAFVFVQSGTVNNGSGWTNTAAPGGTIDVTAINWVQFSGAGTYTASTGLTLIGSAFSITNTAVVSASYGTASSVPTFVVNAQGQITSASNTAIAIANTAVSGLGTMSTQNANAVAITGGTINVTSIGATTPATGVFTTLNTTGSISGASNFGPISYGNLGYTDTNIFASFQTSANSYAQIIVQNVSSGTAASSDVVIGNNLTTSTTYFGDLGMNSSGFTGTGALGAASTVYLTATTSDLAIGTVNSNAIHFVVNSGATDAMTISSAGLVSVPNAAIAGGTINGTTIGATTTSTGAFTTLSASSTVSGTGFSTYLASPPAIGGTASAAGSFTTLSASLTATLNTFVSSGVTITGGTINGATIGATAASTGKFTTVTATSGISGGTF